MTETIREWRPEEGDLCQGDVLMFQLPKGFAPARTDAIQPRDDKLILAEGEATGHHHAIWFNPPMFRDDGLARGLAPNLQDDVALRGDGHSAADAQTPPAAPEGMAALYRDDELVRRLVKDDLLRDASLCVGFLVVEAPVLLRHQEHDAIRVPPGLYYVGRQREFVRGVIHGVSD